MQLIPKSLFWRFLLIIILPILLLQLVITIIFYQRHWDNITSRMQYNLIGEIKGVLNIAQKYPINHESLEVLDPLNLKIVRLTPRRFSVLQKGLSSAKTDMDILEFSRKLQAEIPNLKYIGYNDDHSDIISIFHLDREYIQITFSNKRIKSPTTYIFMIWMLATSSLLILISVMFMRNQIRSIIRLVEVADHFGKGHNIALFYPSGAKEIRMAGYAFLRMKQRIERQIKYRTELLTHISHDLRTPLTRLKLQIEMLKERSIANEMGQDLNEMEQLIKSYLDFAKGEGNEVVQKMDIIEIIKNTINKFSDNRIVLKLPSAIQEMDIRPHALQRAINNLVENAIKYAHHKIEILAYKHGDNFLIVIDDDGEGIEEQYRKVVFKPFHQVTINKDGYGLGLAIAKSIVQAHGGKIKLAQSPYNGLRVIMIFPI